LAHTIVADASLVNKLDAFRKKRNLGDYERAGSTSVPEATEARDLARRLGDDVLAWLHPELLSLCPCRLT